MPFYSLISCPFSDTFNTYLFKPENHGPSPSLPDVVHPAIYESIIFAIFVSSLGVLDVLVNLLLSLSLSLNVPSLFILNLITSLQRLADGSFPIITSFYIFHLITNLFRQFIIVVTKL